MEQNETILEPLTFEIIERADDASMKVAIKYAELCDSYVKVFDYYSSPTK